MVYLFIYSLLFRGGAKGGAVQGGGGSLLFENRGRGAVTPQGGGARGAHWPGGCRGGGAVYGGGKIFLACLKSVFAKGCFQQSFQHIFAPGSVHGCHGFKLQPKNITYTNFVFGINFLINYI